VEEHLQVGPYVVDVVGVTLLQDSLDHGKKPAGDAGQVGDVGLHRLVDQQRELDGPVLHQRDALAGNPHQVGHGRASPDHGGAQVADMDSRIRQSQLVGERTAEDETLAAEHSAGGVAAQVQRHGIGGAWIMSAVQGVAGDGYELGLAAAGAAGLRVVAADSGPQQALLPPDHTHHRRADILVFHGRHVPREPSYGIAAAGDGIEVMPEAYPCHAGTPQQAPENPLLNLLALRGPAFRTLRPPFEQSPHQRCKVHSL